MASDIEYSMVALKCPKCRSTLEIDDKKLETEGKTAVFCSNEECFFYNNPLIGIDRKEPGIYLSESIL